MLHVIHLTSWSRPSASNVWPLVVRVRPAAWQARRLGPSLLTGAAETGAGAAGAAGTVAPRAWKRSQREGVSSCWRVRSWTETENPLTQMSTC